MLKNILVWFCFLFLIIVEVSHAADQCSADVIRAGHGKLYDCGWVGITESQCLGRHIRGALDSCCFDQRQAPQCYWPNSTKCYVEPQLRLDCGWTIITREECERRSCCYNLAASAPACYFPENSLCLNTKNRVDCGWTGITRAECEFKGCCFETKHNPQCYYPKAKPPPTSISLTYIPLFLLLFLVTFWNYFDQQRNKRL
jgi:hypothetical protein